MLCQQFDGNDGHAADTLAPMGACQLDVVAFLGVRTVFQEDLDVLVLVTMDVRLESVYQ